MEVPHTPLLSSDRPRLSSPLSQLAALVTVPMSPLTGPRHHQHHHWSLPSLISSPRRVARVRTAVFIPCNILWLSPVCVPLCLPYILLSCLPSTCKPVTSRDGQQCGARLELCCYILLSYQLTSQTSTHCLPHQQHSCSTHSDNHPLRHWPSQTSSLVTTGVNL